MILMSLIKIKKSFGDIDILKEINLDIKKGKTLGLVGFNGAGKTTLAKIIAGLVNADSGTIKTNQIVNVGYLKQSTEFTELDLTNIFIEDSKDIMQISSLLGLKNLKNWSFEKLEHLSGGEKMKLSLADIFNEKVDLLIR